MDRDVIQTTATLSGPCRYSVSITVPASEVSAAINVAAKKYRKQARVPGFRPGKIPEAIIRKRFGDSIRSDVRQQLVQLGTLTAIERNEAKPAAMPDITDTLADVVENEDFCFAVEFDAAPQFDLPNYRDIPLTRSTSDVSDSDLDEALDSLRRRRPNYEKVERPAAIGDLVQVSYQGTLADDADIPDTAKRYLNAEETWLELGENESLPGVTGGLTGQSAGDSTTFSVTFPDDYHESFLAGREVSYAFNVREVNAIQLPELDDAFAQTMGVDTIQALRERLMEQLKHERERQVRGQLEQQVYDYLLDGSDFELPRSVVASETVSNFRRLQSLVSQGGGDTDKEALREEAAKTAERSVRLRYLLQAIAESENVTVPDEELDAIFDYSRQQAQARRRQNEPEVDLDMLRANIESNLVMERTMERIIELGKLTVE